MTAVLNPELDGDFKASVTFDLPDDDDDDVVGWSEEDVVVGSPTGPLVSLIMIRVQVWSNAYKGEKISNTQ